MKSENPLIENYQAPYYNSYGHLGNSYLLDRNVRQTLRNLGKYLVSKIDFETHLDAGCAMGHLVEYMRSKGKRSYGVDFSQYAVDNAWRHVAQYIWQQDLTSEKIANRYDIVTCIEVLEHINTDDESFAIQNLCDSASIGIYFSSDMNYDEPTHINIHSRDYWIDQFEQRGFSLDKDIHFAEIDWGFFVRRI